LKRLRPQYNSSDRLANRYGKGSHRSRDSQVQASPAPKSGKDELRGYPAGLLESELFGHERGAFTGAVNSHVGRFAWPIAATLFLDEIGDLPLELQPKLLRVYKNANLRPVGSMRTTRVDVRVVAGDPTKT